MSTLIGVGLCLTYIIHWVWQSLGPSVLLQMASSRSFMAEQYSVVYMRHIFFTHPSVRGHAGCPHVLAAVTTGRMCLFGWWFSPGICPGARLQDHVIFFSFLRTLHPVLHRGCTSLHSRMGHLKEHVHYSGNWQIERKSEACILPFLKKLSLGAVKQLRRGSFSLQIIPNEKWRRNTLSRISAFCSPRAVNDPGSDRRRLLEMLLTN